MEAARRAAQRAAERGEPGGQLALRTGAKRWVHDHDVAPGRPAPHDDDWADRQTGADVSTHTHFSELVRAQHRNADHMAQLVDSWRAELQLLNRGGLRDRAAAAGISIAQFEEAEGTFDRKNSHHRKAAVIDLIIKSLKANYFERERLGQEGGVVPPRVQSRLRSSGLGSSGRLAETATVVRDVKELRRAVASTTGSSLVELAAGVSFVLADSSLLIRRSLQLRAPREASTGAQPRLITRGLGFPAIEASGSGCRCVTLSVSLCLSLSISLYLSVCVSVVYGYICVARSRVLLEGLRVETGGGRSQGAAMRVVGGCSLSARDCVFHGSVVASGQQVQTSLSVSLSLYLYLSISISLSLSLWVGARD